MPHPDSPQLSVDPDRHGTGSPGAATYDNSVAVSKLRLQPAANLSGGLSSRAYCDSIADGDPDAIADAQDAGDLDADGEWIPYERSY